MGCLLQFFFEADFMLIVVFENIELRRNLLIIFKNFFDGVSVLLFQSFNLVSRSTAIKNVLTSMVPDMNFMQVLLGLFSKDQKMHALEALDKVGILDKAYTRCDQLSGGQQQRVLLARALCATRKVLLLDEPTKALDAFAAAGIADVLKTLAAQGVTVVAVTHDTDFAAKVADRCALFFRGEMISIDEPQAFFAANTFYTTTTARITKGYYDDVVTAEDAAALCLLNGRKDGAL